MKQLIGTGLSRPTKHNGDRAAIGSGRTVSFGQNLSESDDSKVE